MQYSDVEGIARWYLYIYILTSELIKLYFFVI